MRMIIIIRTTFCKREEDDNNKQHLQHHVQNNTIKLPKGIDNQVYMTNTIASSYLPNCQMGECVCVCVT